MRSSATAYRTALRSPWLRDGAPAQVQAAREQLAAAEHAAARHADVAAARLGALDAWLETEAAEPGDGRGGSAVRAMAGQNLCKVFALQVTPFLTNFEDNESGVV